MVAHFSRKTDEIVAGEASRGGGLDLNVRGAGVVRLDLFVDLPKSVQASCGEVDGFAVKDQLDFPGHTPDNELAFPPAGQLHDPAAQALVEHGVLVAEDGAVTAGALFGVAIFGHLPVTEGFKQAV